MGKKLRFRKVKKALKLRSDSITPAIFTLTYTFFKNKLCFNLNKRESVVEMQKGATKYPVTLDEIKHQE